MEVKLKCLLKSVLICVMALGVTHCQKEDKKGKAGVKVRSTGSGSLQLAARQGLAAVSPKAAMLLADARQSGMLTLDYYKVPISRINLVAGLKGTGYSSASPNLYACAATTDDECLVDLGSESEVDNLLKTAGSDSVAAADAQGASEAEMDPAIYDGVAVEFCHEFNAAAMGSTDAGYYEARLKGTVVLNGTTYYTNTTDGLSTSSPAEEVKVRVEGAGCGVTTPLLTAIEVVEDSTINVVLHTDPTGAIFATNDKTYANSSCVGESTLAVCTDPVAVFGTVDDTAPTVERYRLTFGGSYADVIATFLFNSSDTAFGATFRHLFDDTEISKTLHSSVTVMKIETNNGLLTLKGYGSDESEVTFVSDFERASHTGTLLEYVDADIAYTATKL